MSDRDTEGHSPHGESGAPRIGEILIAQDHLTDEQLEEALSLQEERRRQGQPPMSVYLRTAEGTTAPIYRAVHTRESAWESTEASD